MVEVVVAEPNPLLRIGLKAVLQQTPDIVIVDEVVDAEELLAAVRTVRHDVGLIGLGLLREAGTVRFGEARRAKREYRILVHSYEWDPGFGAEAARFGAAGYFSHECSAADLRAAVLDVAAGKPFITPALGAELATAACFRADQFQRVSLSTRERNVFRMIAIGLSVRGIAAQLGVSELDVAECKRRIMAKIDAQEAGELLRHAIDQACRYRPQPETMGERPSR
jgi:DNA-binding NarL/FixJ family response regulator